MFGDEIKIIISAIDKTGDVFKNVSKNLEGVGKSITSVGKNITLLTAPLAIFGVLSIKTFGDFNSEIQRAGSYVDATADQIKEFGDIAIKSAQGTTFSAVQVAKALGSFVGGSIDAATATKELGGVIDFALISRFENLNEAVEISYAMLTQFSKEGLTMKNVTDTMAVVLSNVSDRAIMYSDILNSVAGSVKSVGYNFKEMNILVSAFVLSGAKMDLVGTAIERGLKFMRIGSDNTREALEDVGLSFAGLSKAIEEGPIPMLQYLQSGLVDTSGKVDYLKLNSIVGTLAVGEFEKVLGLTGDQLQTIGGYFDDVNGKSDKMLQTIKDSIPPLIALKNELEKLAIQVGSILAPILIPLIEKLKQVFAWFERLSPSTQKVIVYLGLFAVVLGPLLIILGTLITSITAVAGVLAAITLPIAAVILAIGGLVAAGIYLVANWEKAKGGVLYIWETIRDIVKARINEIKSYWETLMTWIQEQLNKVQRFIDNIKNAVSNISGSIGNLGGRIIGGVRGLLPFQEGGIVPGSIGQPIPALVHGGETIIPAGRGLGNLNLTITGNTFMSDREAALRIGDIIIQQLKMNLRF